MFTHVNSLILIRKIKASCVCCKHKIDFDPETSLDFFAHLMNKLRRFSDVNFGGASSLQLHKI